ncbi:MAG TPA: DNA primase, partial [Pyrinomonadaceae bacterium]
LPELVDDKRFETKRKEADEVIQLNAWALEFWERHLAEDNAEARAAREYVEGRGLSAETVKTFRLGYAPNSWDALGNYLKSKGASIGQIERSGLVVKKEQGGYYDRFRGRLIFPVVDAQGRAVAFGARAMRPGDEPKYLNSPETPAYTKGRHLFGLNVTREEIRRKKFAILVEGYLDLIAPFQHGVRNVVASLGTALTPEQAKLLNRFARKVVVNYDGDRAGINAAKRAIEVLLPEDFEVKVLVLPEGADPDEFVRAHGAEEYNRRRGQAVPHMQFVLEQATRERTLRNPAQKAEAVEEVLPFVRAVRNPIQKREYFDMAMDVLQVNLTTRKELWGSVAKPADNTKGETVKQVIARAEAVPPTESEKRLLALLMHDDELRRGFLPLLEEGDYEELQTAAIFRALKAITHEATEVSFDSLSEKLKEHPELTDLLARLWMSEPHRAEGEAMDDVATASECFLVALRIQKADRHLEKLKEEIRSAQNNDDRELAEKLVCENLELTQYRRQLKAAFTSIGVSDSLAFGIQ